MLSALGQVNDIYIEEAASTIGKGAARRRFRPAVSAALIAAAVCVLLMGAGVVAVIFGDNIQNWFAHQWEAITGQAMSEGQGAVIDRLSQKIGASQTIDGVTVTVDSATMGDGTFYLLLRVEGLRLSKRDDYAFDEVEMKVDPDPLADSGGLGGYGFQYQGLDGNGAALILMDYNYSSQGGYVEDTRALEVSLTLKDFVRGAHTTRQKMLAEGEWTYVFSIDRTQIPDAVSLPDTEVLLRDRDTGGEVPVLFRNIKLTNTGIRFQFDDHEGSLAISGDLDVILKSGAEVHNSGGIGIPLEGSAAMDYSFQWQFPVDLDEVACIRVGSTRILLP